MSDEIPKVMFLVPDEKNLQEAKKIVGKFFECCNIENETGLMKYPLEYIVEMVDKKSIQIFARTDDGHKGLNPFNSVKVKDPSKCKLVQNLQTHTIVYIEDYRIGVYHSLLAF